MCKSNRSLQLSSGLPSRRLVREACGVQSFIYHYVALLINTVGAYSEKVDLEAVFPSYCGLVEMSSWPIIETDDSDSEEDYLTHQCRRFRILIMGKAGVGKSTLLSMVFGIPEDDVSRAAPKYLHVALQY
jgi:hypothetical protein